MTDISERCWVILRVCGDFLCQVRLWCVLAQLAFTGIVVNDLVLGFLCYMK